MLSILHNFFRLGARGPKGPVEVNLKIACNSVIRCCVCIFFLTRLYSLASYSKVWCCTQYIAVWSAYQLFLLNKFYMLDLLYVFSSEFNVQEVKRKFQFQLIKVLCIHYYYNILFSKDLESNSKTRNIWQFCIKYNKFWFRFFFIKSYIWIL